MHTTKDKNRISLTSIVKLGPQKRGVSGPKIAGVLQKNSISHAAKRR